MIFMRVLYPRGIGSQSVGFCGGRKTGDPGEKPSEQGREPTTNSTHICHRAGIEPAPHWWEANALTTAPSMKVIR